MPVAREKVGRRRTVSSSSDTGQLQSPPRPRFFAVDFEPNDMDNDLLCHSSTELTQQCCSPKCAHLPEFDPISPDSELVKMICSNEKCHINPFMHASCFMSFEEQMLSFLRGMSRARSWSEKQRRQNLWTKKGYDLIFRVSTCRCGKGALRRDLSYNGTPVSGGSGGGTESGEKGRRKRKKSASGEKMAVPIRAGNGAQRARSRTTCRTSSDPFSSENGAVVSSAPTVLSSVSAYMQPFAHRTDYAIFKTCVPRHLVNSYHIKMEDDGYGAGDDTRSFVLSSLAFHRTSFVNCVLCNSKLTVYDQFPLLDGTFFLSPLKLSNNTLEVESKGDNSAFLSAVCLCCLVGINKVSCSYCLMPWNGNAHQIGTMYSYDIFSAFPCCPASVQCNKCKQALVELKQLSLSFSQLSSRYKCGNCSTCDFHFVKPISRFQVSIDSK